MRSWASTAGPPRPTGRDSFFLRECPAEGQGKPARVQSGPLVEHSLEKGARAPAHQAARLYSEEACRLLGMTSAGWLSSSLCDAPALNSVAHRSTGMLGYRSPDGRAR